MEKKKKIVAIKFRSSSKNNKGKSVPSKIKKPAEVFVSKYNIIDFDKLLEIAEINLFIKLDQSRADSGSFELKVPINITLRKVIEKINERHCNSCKSIKLYIVEDSSKKYMDVVTYKTFQELGFKPNDNLNLYYEYEPVMHPLLQMGLV